MKNFFLKIYHNKIKSRAQRAHYDTIDNGNCLDCPVNVKDTAYHNLFDCQSNKNLLAKIKSEYLNTNDINFDLHNFLTGNLSSNASLSQLGYLIFICFAKTIHSNSYRRCAKWPYLKIIFTVTLKKILCNDADFRAKMNKLHEIGLFKSKLEDDLDKIVQ